MATLLLWALYATLSGGCLAFEDYPVLSDLPPPRDQNIRCVGLANPSDAQTVVTAGASTACQTEFAAKFEDLDVNDTIRSVWYVDDNTNLGLQGNPVFSDGSTVRRVTSPIGINNALSGFTDSTYHLVTVLASDSEWSSSPNGGKLVWQPTPISVTLTDGTVVTTPGSWSFCQWFVKVKACP